MADDILAGMEPLAALRKALDHKRKTEQEIVAKKADFERRRRIKEFARAQWIQQNLPKELQDDSVIY
jgi:hypothetical protein